MSTIQPSSFGGFGRSESIEGKFFVAKSPPDIQPNTRIVAVCGITDLGNDADPQESGWMLSDFYLFHHLLKSDDTHRTANQIWLTAVDPRALVGKYTMYLHGPANGDRRIVLDEANVDDVVKSSDIRVVSNLILKERFLLSLRQEMRTAKELSQPVLVLIFAHGQALTHSIEIGGEGFDNPYLIEIDEFDQAMVSGVDITMLITSCYSGGWLLHKGLSSPGSSSLTPLFDMSAVTAAGPENVSLSWPSSNSAGRSFGGSIVATAILNGLIETSEETPGLRGGMPSIIPALNDRDEYIPNTPTYASLAQSVHNALQRLDPERYDDHCVSFAAQSDEWEKAWRSRSGIPLSDYKKRWESLRIQPEGPIVGVSDAPQATGSGGNLTNKRLRARVIFLGERYLQTNPGADNLGTNVALHSRVKKHLGIPDHFPEEQLLNIEAQLKYRLLALRQAEIFRAFLNLKFPPPSAYDEDEWKQKLHELRSNPETDAQGKKLKETQNQFFKLMFELHIFETPPRGCRFYDKPTNYLAIALLENGNDYESGAALLRKLSNRVMTMQKRLRETSQGQTAMRDPEVVHERSRFWEDMKKKVKRLRSLSPIKRARTSMDKNPRGN